MGGLGEVAGPGDPQALRVGHDEGAGRVGPAEPLLAGDREEVETRGVDRDRTNGLGAVDQHRHARLLAQLAHGKRPAARPEHLRKGEQLRPRRHHRQDRVRVRLGHDDAGAARVHRPDQAEVLLGCRHDLVLRLQVEPGQNDVAAVRRRAGQRDLLGLGADEAGEDDPGLLAELEHALEVLLAEAAVGEIGVELLLHGRRRRARERAERPGVQIREPLEHGEERPAFLGRHPILISTGA